MAPDTSSALDLTFFALADPTRRALLAQLALGEASVNELVKPFGLAQPTISKHLKVLERAGLITRRKQANLRPCTLNAAPLRQASSWLQDYEGFWSGSLDRLDAYVRSLHESQTPPANPASPSLKRSKPATAAKPPETHHEPRRPPKIRPKGPRHPPGR